MFEGTPVRASLAGLVILTFAAFASADSITATLDGLYQHRFVDVTYNGTDFNGVWTGQLNWTRTGGDWNGKPPLGPFTSFCIEISQDVWIGQSYTYEHAPLTSGPAMTAFKADSIRELWGRHYDQIVDHDTSAAFQLAVWEIMSDNQWKLNDGIFKVRYSGSAAPGYYTTAADWLGSIDGTGPRGSVAVMLDPLYQDQITASPVPSPVWGGLLLLMLAFGHRAYRHRVNS